MLLSAGPYLEPATNLTARWVALMKRKIMGKDRPLARAWELIFTTLDDYSRRNADLDLQWIPAHAAKGSTGFARLTDGRKLTENDRNSNNAPHEIA